MNAMMEQLRTSTLDHSTLGGNLLDMIGRASSTAGSEIKKFVMNEYGRDQPMMGWIANTAHIVSHEALAVYGATQVRELAGGLVEAMLNKHDVLPDQRAAGVIALYTLALLGNMVSLYSTRKKGELTKTAAGGYAMQMFTLLGGVVLAGLLGRNKDGNGHFGDLATLLPSAVKSYVYCMRDLINLAVPLKNIELPSDNENQKKDANPVATQAADGLPYAANQFSVNEIQGELGTSGAGLADALHEGMTSFGEGVKHLVTYVAGNQAGETLDAFAQQVLGALMKHGPTKETLTALKDLRTRWSTIDTSEKRFSTQLGDKLAGPMIARLSLFLSVYTIGSAIARAVSGTGLSDRGKQTLDNALVAILIAADCIPFAMSTMRKGPTGEQPSANLQEVHDLEAQTTRTGQPVPPRDDASTSSAGPTQG